MLILLDHSAPRALRRHLVGHTVHTAVEKGWDRLPDDRLISPAQQSGCQLLITADQGIRYQQNPAAIRIAVIVLMPNNWRLLRPRVDDIIAAVNVIGPWEYRAVVIV